MLGPIASPAVPELAKMLGRTNWFTCDLAAGALAAIGKDGLPALVNSFNDRKNLNRFDVAYHLVFAYRNAQHIDAEFPALERMLNDDDPNVVRNTIVALANPPLKAERSVLLLARLTKHTDMKVRRAAVSGLGNFASNAQTAIPMLVGCLVDTNSTVREAATNAIEKIAPQVLTNGVKGL
jgi:HEAT repeat protein